MRNLILHQFEGVRINDGRVRVLDVILRNFTVILLDGFGMKVCGIVFLKQGISFVVLILENAHNGGNAPLLFI